MKQATPASMAAYILRTLMENRGYCISRVTVLKAIDKQVMLEIISPDFDGTTVASRLALINEVCEGAAAMKDLSIMFIPVSLEEDICFIA